MPSWRLAKAVEMNVERSKHWRFGSLWPALGKLRAGPKDWGRECQGRCHESTLDAAADCIVARM